jgi:chorismate synthase
MKGKTTMNSFGSVFRVSIFGESHGKGVGIVIDGAPAGIPFREDDLLPELKRRQSGRPGTTPRREADNPEILSGTFDGKTTGAPLTVFFENADTRSRDYTLFKEIPRPGHADFTASKKYGSFNDFRGSGHFSGRLTLGLVSAGALAKKIIAPITLSARLIEAGGESDIDAAVGKALERKDSIGGIVECTAVQVPVGLGEPFFNSVESQIAHIAFSIPAVKGIEFGAGFQAAKMSGSRHNDNFIRADGRTETNHAGGINGGITNGNDLVFRVVVKPASSISLPQRTVNVRTGELETLIVEGRHDTCIALRVPVVLEAATAIVLADFCLMEQRAGRVFAASEKIV